MGDDIVKELRDFNHNKAADYIEFLQSEIRRIETAYEATIERLERKLEVPEWLDLAN